MKSEKLLIATSGYLNQETRVEKLVFTDKDEVFLEEFEDFEDYTNSVVKDKAAEYEQGFSQVLVIEITNAEALAAEILKAARP